MKIKIFNLFVMCMLIPGFLTARQFTKEDLKLKENELEMSVVKIGDFISELSEGIPLEKLKNTILECPAGTAIPFRFTLRGDLLGFEPYNPLEISLKFLKPCYILHRNKHLLFSTDKKIWLPADQFLSGKAGAFLSFENQLAIANYELELNSQKNRWEVAHCSNWRLRWRTTDEGRKTDYPFKRSPKQIPLADSELIEKELLKELNPSRNRSF